MDLIKKISEELSQKHSYQTEFHEAVIEILEDVAKSDEFSNDELLHFFKRLIEPDRTIRFKVEWDDDNGITQTNRAWRVQFNNALGVYKGGLRFHPNVSESTFKFLAFEQIFKNALTGLPMGGAKGGSDFNPKGKSPKEVKRFCQSLMTELHRYIGSSKDVPAGDIGVGTREIGFLYGQYLKLTSNYDGVLTGKHPSFGGSCGRVEATGHGVIYLLNEAMKAHDKNLKGQSLLISGSGNVALYAADKAIELGAKVLTVSDSGGTLYFKDGVSRKDLEKLITFKTQDYKRLNEWTKIENNFEYLEGKKPWSIKADIALPCATENEIDEEEAKNLISNNIVAVAEGANMPLTSNAIKLVQENNIVFLPGKAANAGGVAVSGLERVQNASNISWDLKRVDEQLKEIMKEIHENCSQNVEKINDVIPYKMGANLFAFKKLKKTMDQLWP